MTISNGHWHLCDCDECLNPPELYEGKPADHPLMRGGNVVRVGAAIRKVRWEYLTPPESIHPDIDANGVSREHGA